MPKEQRRALPPDARNSVKGQGTPMEMLRQRPACSLNAAQLKWFAVLIMLVDHLASVVLDPVCAALSRPDLRSGLCLEMRVVGRLSFPVFCFLIAEGFRRTHDRRAYCLRLALFALLSEPFFDAASSGAWIAPARQSALGTLLLGLLTLWGIERCRGRRLLQAVCLLGGCLAAELLRTDYGLCGVALIAALHSWRGQPAGQLLVRMAVLLFAGTIGSVLVERTLLAGAPPGRVLYSGAQAALLETAGALSAIPICCYNGEKGGTAGRYFFYVFYPAHLLVLVLLRQAVLTCVTV